MGTKPSTIKLCSIIKAELLYGASRSNDASTVLARLETFFAPYESLPFDVRRGGGIWPHSGHLAGAGTPIWAERSDDRCDCPVPPFDPGHSQHSRILACSRLLIEDWELP